MKLKSLVWQAVLTAAVLSAPGTANADWLAADPGTPISLQLNVNGTLVVRPVGGTWTHAVCPDATAAELTTYRIYQHTAEFINRAREILVAAAASGSIVNVFADAEVCDEHGHPVIRNLRVQGP